MRFCNFGAAEIQLSAAGFEMNPKIDRRVRVQDLPPEARGDRFDDMNTEDITNEVPPIVSKKPRPGGFWIRFIASIIDGVIIAIPTAIIGAIMGFVMSMVFRGGSVPLPFLAFSQGVSMVIGILISLSYYTYFYQSTGSTLGKKVFQLKVVDATTGNLLTFKQVFLREIVGKILSSITFMIGYIMAGLRGDKRALHDLIADTRVEEMTTY
jgi:uncharacterized RDD family membrane protein YckC